MGMSSHKRSQSFPEVRLDNTEKVLVPVKRHKIINGRKMVALLALHQREVRGAMQ